MIEIRKQLDAQSNRAHELGVTEEELAFYDALAADASAAYDDEFLRDLVHEVVQTVKRNLRVDWTRPIATTCERRSGPRSSELSDSAAWGQSTSIGLSRR
jgi:hypothetical protein